MLRPQAIDTLMGSDYIVHAGDVGDVTIPDRLRELAPVTIVRGNVDREPWATAWPETDVLHVGGVLLYVLHDLAALDLDPAIAGFSAVIFGHSHKPALERQRGVLFVNPGSAGPRRFSLPISVGILDVNGTELSARLIDLKV